MAASWKAYARRQPGLKVDQQTEGLPAVMSGRGSRLAGGVRRGGFVLALAALLAGPLVTFALVDAWDDEELSDLQSLDRDQDPLTVAPGTAVWTGQAEATVEMAWADAPLFSATSSYEGTVTFVADPSNLEHLTVGYRVEGEAVLLYEGSTPFFRELSWGDVGDDVAQLRALLSELDLLDTADPETPLGRADRRAIVALNRQLGRGVDNGVFDPAATQWIPPGEIALIETLLVKVGDPGPSHGDAVAAGQQKLERAVLSVRPVDGPSPPASVVNDAEYLFTPSDELAWGSVFEALALQVGEIPAATLRQLQPLSGTAELAGSAQLLEPVRAWRVPGSAIFQNDGGVRTCVVESTSLSALEVEVLGADLSGTIVRFPNGNIPDRVFANHRAVAAHTTCDG